MNYEGGALSRLGKKEGKWKPEQRIHISHLEGNEPHSQDNIFTCWIKSHAFQKTPAVTIS